MQEIGYNFKVISEIVNSADRSQLFFKGI